MSLKEFCEIIDGKVCYKTEDFKMPRGEDGRLFNVVTDSRDVKEGSIFVCLKGEFHDGHDYARQAMEDGARITIIAEDKKADIMKTVGDVKANNTSLISVKSPLYAMGELAKWYIAFLGVKTIGITGSVGKTTVKDMIASIFSQSMNTYKTKGNFNSLIGLPLTALSVPRGTELCVFELGMDAEGEIDRLSEIMAPDIAIITKIGISHVERLGSRENIFKAKSEIINHIKPGGTLILGVDEDEQYLKKEKFDGNFNVIEVTTKDCSGTDSGLYCVKNIKDDVDGVCFEFSGGGCKKSLVNVNTHGIHNALNAGLATACGIRFGMDLEKIKEGLKNVDFTAKRLEIKEKGGITFIDDSYNASPESMNSALRVLGQIAEGRRVAVLGDMNELGGDSENFHMVVGELAFEQGVEKLIAVGEKGKGYIKGFLKAVKARGGELEFAKIEEEENSIGVKKILDCKNVDELSVGVFSGTQYIIYLDRPVEIAWIEDAEKCRSKFRKYIKRGDWVLLKASNALKLSCILEDR